MTANIRSLVAALVVSAVAVTIIAASATTIVDHRTTRVHAERELDQRILLVAEHVRAVIQTDVMLLGRVADHFAGRPLPAFLEADADRKALRAMLKEAGGVDSIWVYDEYGDAVLSTTEERHGRFNVADREYFQATRAGERLFVSPLIWGRVTGGFFIVVARRLEDSSGAFRGVAMVGVPADRFPDFYRRIAGDEKASLAVRKLNGDVVVRTPLPIAEPPKGWPKDSYVRERLTEEAGVYERTSVIDGIGRLYAFRRLDPEGLVVIAGRPLDALFAPWWSRTLLVWGLGGGGVALSLALSVLVLRAARREADALRDALRAVRESEERFDMAVAATADGIWDWDLRTNRVRRTARMKALYGLADHEMGDDSQEFWDLLHPDDGPVLRAAVQAHLERRSEQVEAECRVRHKDGSWRWLFVRGRAQFGADGEPLRMVGMMTDVTERRERELLVQAAHRAAEAEKERARHAANHDPLTGLPNRAYLTERLTALTGAAVPDGARQAVMLLDLDDFKAVNDTLGHPAGDELLRIVADRLRSCLRDGDFVARLGGDEFAVVVPAACGTACGTLALAERIVATVGQGAVIAGRPVRVGCSAGVSVWAAAALEPEEAIRQADVALYEAKRTGKNRVVLQGCGDASHPACGSGAA
ncbi:diguanylate cyclase domain-containing protein [Azospirillum argentinense]|uniref:diguanylate cyclase domain-containing protein n=1 Tax=Azospirillum argentinense TaxID=2970906 RepID=UPI001586DC3B|nr:diguanylate cyclase [Azospirillum argentinense]